MTSQSGLTRRLSDADEIVPDSEYVSESELRHGSDQVVRETSRSLHDNDTDAIMQMFTEKEFETSDLLEICGPFLLSDTAYNVMYMSPGIINMIPDTSGAASLPVTSLFHPDDRPILTETLSAQTHDGSIMARLKLKDCSYAWSNITIRQGNKNIHRALYISNTDELYRSYITQKKSIATLEQKAADLTRQLEAVNKELEAFSYSVSHDMRAPIRIINGYAHILETDYCADMGEECRRLFDIILTNTGQMNQMIEAVLGLSRISQKELFITDTDMPALVKAVTDEQLSAVDNSDKINIETGNIISTRCDSVLIKCVWKHLISNALKFTAQEATPHITIGSERKGDKVVYYIKDNGIGFDMQYAEKLFGIFQRLHKRTAYPGQGAGLATVKRIVMKHGGNIWAEAGTGMGATFYFSLPVTDQ